MTRKYIPVESLVDQWRKDPEFVKAYDALEEEFSLASALIEARARANLTQEEVAQRMGTTQTAVARLEGARSMPSTRTLERYAKATGHRLRIAFVPDDQPTR
ncbi:DNA-binding XRE family transcriptional regulator [Skermanella aerolata]|uniref:helix-turn-helix domain-containing protein n=1 Tax=Skermanella aerolata TaxID=393310 RepID=UPI003D1A56D4